MKHAADSGVAFNVINQISHVQWPSIPNPWACGVFTVLYQIEQSQWWTEDEMLRRQMIQARQVLEHAYQSSLFYRRYYDAAGITPADIRTWHDWHDIPIVSRKSLQEAGESWYSTSIPKDHGELRHSFTSGSTGTPLRSLSTTLTHLYKIALVLRNHQWAKRDTRQKAVFIHETDDHSPAGVVRPGWQTSLQPLIETGAALTLSVRLTVEEQLKRIREFEPVYIIGYPSSVSALANVCLKKDETLPFLRQVGTFGEALDHSCRAVIRAAWGVGVVDGYSAKEIGPIALQCPDSENYHIQSDAVIAEIINAQGKTCEPGEIGRVVLTSLHNFAAPMIRYDIGDYAEAGGTCVCGRTLPVIKRVLGRQRNMLTYPDGSQRWPSLSENGLVELSKQGLPPVKQFQLIQHSRERLEARIVLDRAYSFPEEKLVTGYLRSQLGDHWQIDFSYPDVIHRSARGKYEDVLSLCS